MPSEFLSTNKWEANVLERDDGRIEIRLVYCPDDNGDPRTPNSKTILATRIILDPDIIPPISEGGYIPEITIHNPELYDIIIT